MIKELIICIFIIALIFIGNGVTECYTKKSVEEATNHLGELKEELIKEPNEINLEDAKNKINEIHENWDIRYKKLAYYIEHDELEKVETELTGLRAYIEMNEYSEALTELEKSVYILEHIKDKAVFNLRNIF